MPGTNTSAPDVTTVRDVIWHALCDHSTDQLLLHAYATQLRQSLDEIIRSVQGQSIWPQDVPAVLIFYVGQLCQRVGVNLTPVGIVTLRDKLAQLFR